MESDPKQLQDAMNSFCSQFGEDDIYRQVFLEMIFEILLDPEKFNSIIVEKEPESHGETK